jgi:hypothetical protein
LSIQRYTFSWSASLPNKEKVVVSSLYRQVGSTP